MQHYRWLGVALSVGMLTGCPAGLGLNPQTIDQINSFLGEYGLSLKTVDPTTGESRTYTQSEIAQVIGEDGKPIDYKFEGGRMVFRPKKEGIQRITVMFKDGTTQQFTIEGKKADGRLDGDVAFIPDGSGQGFTTEVGIGREIDVKARHDAMLDQMAAKRVTLTFAGAPLEGLTPETIQAVYFDRMKLPPFTYQVENGKLKVDPNHFFMAREYQKHHGALPPVRIATTSGEQLRVVLAMMAALPQLPEFTPAKPGEVPPPPPGPEAFVSGQVLDLAITRFETVAMTLLQYEQDRGLQTQVPRPGETPPPPSSDEQETFRSEAAEYALTFEVGALAGVEAAEVKAMFVGKMERPVAVVEPNKPARVIDLLGISPEGAITVDAMVLAQAFQLWYGPLNANASDTPWIRIFHEKGGIRRVTAFRFDGAAPDWFRSPDERGWAPPSRPVPADPFWMPPPPPLGSFGKPSAITSESFSYITTDDLPAFKTRLRGYAGQNPVTDRPQS